ncbi:MAG: crossover junction endodeoxyribonuclease RuvC [Candidatus Omnitrophica bacterium CG1_02_41_171]|nr:MAG: crossover junction endodeoxyribonuclease RuvC [Candidatus Omnitrophica bacterium CG1_02_41_171]
MIVLGVDPGLSRTGYGVIEVKDREPSFLDCGFIATSTSLSFPLRLKNIYDTLLSLIDKFQPEVVAIEDTYIAKNAQIALKLGKAAGAAILAAVNKKKEIFSFTPLQIKQNVVGRGNASKEQVSFMVKQILGLKEEPPPDASDALAAALCYLSYHRYENIIEKAG